MLAVAQHQYVNNVPHREITYMACWGGVVNQIAVLIDLITFFISQFVISLELNECIGHLTLQLMSVKEMQCNDRSLCLYSRFQRTHGLLA